MKKLAALLLGIIMVFSITACGSKQLSSDPGELMKTANKNMQKVKSMSAAMNLNMAMTQGKESVTATVQMDMDIIKADDTVKAKIEATANMDELGGAQSITMYMAPEDDKYYVYVGVLGKWMKMEYDMASVLAAEKDTDKNVEALGINAENFKIEDEIDDEGNKVKVISGTISTDAMKEALAEAFESSETIEGVDQTQMQQAKLIIEGCLADIPVSYYIDEKTEQMTKMYADLSEVAKKVTEYITAFTSGTTNDMSGLSIDNLSFTMDFSNFDKVEDFEIPAEALGAQVIDSTTGAGIGGSTEQ